MMITSYKSQPAFKMNTSGFMKSKVPVVPITTNVLGSNPTHGKVYLIQHYMIKFVSDYLQKV
jgi:hypothetical protein